MTPSDNLLITPQALSARMGAADLRIVDGSWYLDKTISGAAGYARAHIAGAVFFDIDRIADQTTTLPHMLPTPDDFADAMGAMGISETDDIIVYDQQGLFSAARVWWTFRLFGATRVRILDGGLPGWIGAGFSVTTTPSLPTASRFVPAFDASRVATLARMRAHVADSSRQIVDARPGPRFSGNAPEPRPGLPSGHMPGARNVPTAALVTNGRLNGAEDLKRVFATAGVDPAEPVVTTCGSGIAAAIVSLALARLGAPDVTLYDGSWTEWAYQPDTPIANRSA